MAMSAEQRARLEKISDAGLRAYYTKAYAVSEMVAKIANVPAARQGEFFGAMQDVVQRATVRYWPKPHYSDDKQFQKIKNQLKLLARAVTALDRRLDKLNPDVIDGKSLARIILRGKNDDGEEEDWTAPVVKLAETFAFLTGENPRRRKGDIRDYPLQVLVSGLWAAASECGGHLPFNKHAGEGDPTTQALRAIAELARGVVPPDIPYGTLERIPRSSLISSN